MPWVNCSELSWAPRHSMPPLAGHSMKWMRDTDGKRYDVVHRQKERPFDQAVDHQPVLVRVDVGAPAMIAFKEQSIGVMMPCRSCSGVKLTEDWGVAVSHGTSRRMTSRSNFGRHSIGPVVNTGPERFSTSSGRRAENSRPRPQPFRPAANRSPQQRRHAKMRGVRAPSDRSPAHRPSVDRTAATKAGSSASSLAPRSIDRCDGLVLSLCCGHVVLRTHDLTRT